MIEIYTTLPVLAVTDQLPSLGKVSGRAAKFEIVDVHDGNKFEIWMPET